MKHILLLAIIFVPYSAGLAASFECANSGGTRVEQILCKSQGLSRLDAELGSAYNVVTKHAVPLRKAGLIAEQKDWIIKVRDRCADEECLINAYAARVHALTSITTNNSTAEYVVDRKEIIGQTSKYQRDLNRFGIPGKLSSCEMMLRLVDQTTSGRDESYGAICALNARDIMICETTMVGKLTVKLYGFAESAEELADFTSANCPPGG